MTSSASTQQATVPPPVEEDAPPHDGDGSTVERVPGLSAREVMRRLLATDRTGECSTRDKAFFLWQLSDRRLYGDLGFSSMREVGQVLRTKLAPKTIRDYCRVARRLSKLPEIDAL